MASFLSFIIHWCQSVLILVSVQIFFQMCILILGFSSVRRLLYLSGLIQNTYKIGLIIFRVQYKSMKLPIKFFLCIYGMHPNLSIFSVFNISKQYNMQLNVEYLFCLPPNGVFTGEQCRKREKNQTTAVTALTLKNCAN